MPGRGSIMDGNFQEVMSHCGQYLTLEHGDGLCHKQSRVQTE